MLKCLFFDSCSALYDIFRCEETLSFLNDCLWFVCCLQNKDNNEGLNFNIACPQSNPHTTSKKNKNKTIQSPIQHFFGDQVRASGVIGVVVLGLDVNREESTTYVVLILGNENYLTKTLVLFLLKAVGHSGCQM